MRYGEQLLPPFESSRAESLLAYLLLHRDAPQPRQRIAATLWPESSEGQARTNLRHVLHQLRRDLPEPERFIDITQRTLQWRADAPWQLDVAEFEAAIARGELRRAVDLYRGDLLPGCYDEWIAGARDQLRQQYLLALEHVARALEEEGDYLGAILYAGRLQVHDPLYEETYRLLMRLHAARGDRARAVRIYHECATTLERELGVEPSGPTRAAYEALLAPTPDGDVAEPPVQHAPAGRISSPLVGRARSWEVLTGAWLAAEGGAAGLVLLAGEAGIGKTRLVEEFQAWCAGRGAAVATARSYAAEGALAYGPVVEWLRAEALAPRINRVDPAARADLAQLLPELRALHPDLPTGGGLSESEQRQRLFDALGRAMLAPGAPLLVVIDDIQWSDRETLQFLHYLLRVGAKTRLLLVATARREEIDDGHPLQELIAGLRALERLTEIELDRLNHAETAALAGQLAGRVLPDQRAEQLYAETEGNPLFIVEALRAGWLEAQGASSWISPRVQAVIESRLAQLSVPARELVGLAAAIGREFSTDTLSLASEAGGEALVRGLDELWRRRIVREQGVDAYDFSHDKLREVAYLALGPARQRHYHRRVALALERLHAGDLDPVSGQLAGHYEQAGAFDPAASWYLRAARVAQRMHANGEAVRLLDRALELLDNLPETPERRARKLAILAALPGALVSVDGYFSPRVAEMHRRALALAGELGVELEPPLLRSLAVAGLSIYDFDTARHFGAQLRARGERDGDEVLVVQSGYVLGIAAFWSGELAAARRHFADAAARCRPEQLPAHLLHYGHDPESTCLMRLACTLWFLGCPAAASAARDRALAITGELGHLHSRRLALVFANVLAIEMRDAERMRVYAAEKLSPESDAYPQHVWTGLEVFNGYLDALDGQPRRGVARILRVIDDPTLSEQAPGQQATLLRVLLEACALAGDARTGLAAAGRMLEQSNGVRLWEAEAHRFQAGFMAALGRPDGDVEAELDAALRIAREQGARLFELRALRDLLRHRLRRDATNAEPVREELAALLNSLPDGLDAPDFRDAAALITT